MPALDDFEARSPDELSLRKGERVELVERDDDFGDGWYLGKHIYDGRVGLFPEGQQPSSEQDRCVLTNGSIISVYNDCSKSWQSR
jgi:hypothetical protein